MTDLELFCSETGKKSWSMNEKGKYNPNPNRHPAVIAIKGGTITTIKETVCNCLVKT